MPSLSLAEIAHRIGAVVEGDDSVMITGVAGLLEADAGDIAFLANPKYASQVEATRADAVLVVPDWSGTCDCPLLRTENPDKSFGEIATWFAPPPVPRIAGAHPTAVISESAQIGEDVSIGPHVVIEDCASIGNGCTLGAGCYIGYGVALGECCTLRQHVSIREHCVVGDRVVIHNGTVVGSDGFGFAMNAAGSREKIPQIGIVQIGNDVEIGANCTIDRARFGRTRIGHGVKIDNLVMIAHNVVVEDDAVLVAQVGISGSTIIRRKAILAGQVGVAGHLTIGEGAIVGAQGGVTKDIPAGEFWSDYPAVPHRESAKMNANVRRLPQLKAKVADMEKRLKDLEQ